MNDLDMSALTDFDWAGLINTAQTSGLEFAVKIIVAILIFYIGRLVARTLTNALRRLMQKQEVDKILETFLCNVAYWLVMVFVIIAAITHVGVETTSLIAMMGAAGLAVGLALQGSLSNFASGILIVIFRPYRVGDYVEAGGVAGTIQQVQILTTLMKTPDNKEIIVPNSQIMDGTITNYSANETRRIDMVVGVSYSDDLDKVRRTIREIVDADARVLKDPACLIAVSELADSSVNFYVRPWAKTDEYWAVKFDLTEAIKKRFDKDGISFPFPQRDVHLFNES